VGSGLSLIPVLFAWPARDSPFLESLESFLVTYPIEMLYEFEEPFVVDHSKFEEAFGEQATPLRESIQRSVRWYREERPAGT
jgi:hypothetical protein